MGSRFVSFLLDTHVWIWTQESPDHLGRKARKAIEATTEQVCVATISTVEIARLVSMGTIALKGDLRRWIAAAIDSIEGRTIELDHVVAMEAYRLPGKFHKDPADRLLVATARVHDLTFVTADERILAYRGVRTLDARA